MHTLSATILQLLKVCKLCPLTHPLLNLSIMSERYGFTKYKVRLTLFAHHFILYRALSLIVRQGILSNTKYNTCEVQFLFIKILFLTLVSTKIVLLESFRSAISNFIVKQKSLFYSLQGPLLNCKTGYSFKQKI